MTNRLFNDGGAASAKIMLDRRPDQETVARVNDCDGVLRVALVG